MLNPKSYDRGKNIASKSITDRKLKSSLKRTEKSIKSASIHAAQSDYLFNNHVGYIQAENNVEKTSNFGQDQLKEHVDLSTRHKVLFSKSLANPLFNTFLIRCLISLSTLLDRILSITLGTESKNYRSKLDSKPRPLFFFSSLLDNS